MTFIDSNILTQCDKSRIFLLLSLLRFYVKLILMDLISHKMSVTEKLSNFHTVHTKLRTLRVTVLSP